MCEKVINAYIRTNGMENKVILLKTFKEVLEIILKQKEVIIFIKGYNYCIQKEIISLQFYSRAEKKYKLCLQNLPNGFYLNGLTL